MVSTRCRPRPALMIPAGGLVVVPQRDPGPSCQALDRFHEVEMLDVAEEGDDIALGPTPEAVIEAQLRVQRKRR